MLTGVGRAEFVRWAEEACRLIRFPPERKQVFSELLDHLEDARDAGIAAGQTPEKAARYALAQMGDAKEVARQLQKVHRPFWGFLWKWTRVLAVLAAIYLCWNLLGFVLETLDNDRYGPAEMAEYVRPANLEAEILSDFTPKDSARVGGYTISIPRICFVEYHTYRYAHFVLKVSHWNPWLKQPMFYQNLYAVDNLGNRYPPRSVQPAPEDREVCGNLAHSGAFVSYYELWISDVDPQAASFTLGFDDYGISWSIDFPVEGGFDYALE